MTFPNTSLLYNQTTTIPDYYQFYICMQRLTGLILYPIFCILGLSANIIGILVLFRKQMRSSTSSFLIALAIVDSIKIVNDSLYFFVVLLEYISLDNKSFIILYPYAHYIFNASMTSASWITVAVAIERYIFVCHGTFARRFCTVKRATFASSTIIFASFAITVPYVFRYEIWSHHIRVSTLWTNGLFGYVFNWSHYVVRSIIPMCLLMFFAILILRGLRRCRFRNGKLRVCVCILVVVASFIVCMFPDTVISTFVNEGYYEASYLVRGIREITDLLLLFNTLLNFIIYCMFNKLFLKNTKEFFRCKTTGTIPDERYNACQAIPMLLTSKHLRSHQRPSTQACISDDKGELH